MSRSEANNCALEIVKDLLRGGNGPKTGEVLGSGQATDEGEAAAAFVISLHKALAAYLLTVEAA